MSPLSVGHSQLRKLPSHFASRRLNRLFLLELDIEELDGRVVVPALRPQHVVLTLIAVGVGFAISTALALLASTATGCGASSGR